MAQTLNKKESSVRNQRKNLRQSLDTEDGNTVFSFRNIDKKKEDMEKENLKEKEENMESEDKKRGEIENDSANQKEVDSIKKSVRKNRAEIEPPSVKGKEVKSNSSLKDINCRGALNKQIKENEKIENIEKNEKNEKEIVNDIEMEKKSVNEKEKEFKSSLIDSTSALNNQLRENVNENECFPDLVTEPNTRRVWMNSDKRKTVKVIEGIPISVVTEIVRLADLSGSEMDSDLDSGREERTNDFSKENENKEIVDASKIEGIRKRKLLSDGESVEKKTRRMSSKGMNADDTLNVSLSNTPSSIRKKGKGLRRKRCGNCSGCTRSNCGECIFCLDMPRFGGPGSKKQACELRTCVEEEDCHVEDDTFAKENLNNSFDVGKISMLNNELKCKSPKNEPELPSDTDMTPNAKKKHKGKRCKDCEGCQASNCGECVFCLDMPKFGGPGKMKQACEKRTCQK